MPALDFFGIFEPVFTVLEAKPATRVKLNRSMKVLTMRCPFPFLLLAGLCAAMPAAAQNAPGPDSNEPPLRIKQFHDEILVDPQGRTDSTITSNSYKSSIISFSITFSITFSTLFFNLFNSFLFRSCHPSLSSSEIHHT